MRLKTPQGRGWVVALLWALVVLALPYVLPVGDVHHGWWDRIPGWWAWFGGLGCAVIVLVSKLLGRLFLHKPEDWYE